MSETILCIPDQHAHYQHHNTRADLLARLIVDLKPDVVLNGGDCADMPSLSSYDKGKRSFHGRNYRADVDAHLEFQERLWEPVRARKKKMPYRTVLIGNHEQRIEKALDLSPELVGTVGMKDLLFEEYYDEIIPYDGGTPGIWQYEGISFAHYFISGVSGRPIGGENHAKMLSIKNGCSSVAFHSHLLDFSTRKTVDGKTVNTVVCGCYQDYKNDWSGSIASLWWSGVTVLRNVQDGNFDVQFISLGALKKEYA